MSASSEYSLMNGPVAKSELALRARNVAIAAERPKFDAGPLPVKYSPLSRSTIFPGMVFGPIEFQISPSSLKKQIEYWRRQHLSFVDAMEHSYQMFPFLLWCLPRVLSRWYGRLNEVIAVCSEWTINADVDPSGTLVGSVGVVKTSERSGLEFATFKSRTYVPDGTVVLEAEDTWLLANKSDLRILKKLASAEKKLPLNKLLCEQAIVARWRLTMRYIWDSRQWTNNIHVEEYAQHLGYAGALIEGPLVADLLYLFCVASFGEKPRSIRWRFTGPLYSGRETFLLVNRNFPNNEVALAELIKTEGTGSVLVKAVVER